ncbi:hypothetical protein L1887_23674 [Cichorium endivia]|nr:hypothetical protein L1887_23674 [Cichorium endivia]
MATLIGESESFEKLMNIKAFKEVEGNSCLELRFSKRIASIIIYGVPMHAWCEEAFTVIARKWEEVLIPEACDTDNLNLAFGRIGILTDHLGIISTSINIVVDGEQYKFNVIEDVFESNRLNLMLASIDLQDDQDEPELFPDDLRNWTVEEEGEANSQHDVQHWETERRTENNEAREPGNNDSEKVNCENQETARIEVVETLPEVDPTPVDQVGLNNLGPVDLNPTPSQVLKLLKKHGVSEGHQ